MGGPLQNAAGEKAAAHRGEHTARRARRATERGLQPGAVPPRGFTSSALIRPSPWNRIAAVNCLRAYADASRAPGSRTSRRRAAVPCPCAPYRRVPVPRTAVSPCPVPPHTHSARHHRVTASAAPRARGPGALRYRTLRGADSHRATLARSSPRPDARPPTRPLTRPPGPAAPGPPAAAGGRRPARSPSPRSRPA